jgi:glycosyltransferase involved in cell wall biosynthesis
MTERPNPILLYHPDGYRVARDDLKGRHSAGESFLAAFIEHAPGPDVFALCGQKDAAEEFQRTVKSQRPSLAPRIVTRADRAALRRQGMMFQPQPDVAEEARLRAFLGDDAYTICGVTHTISSQQVLDVVADIPVGPTQPWDALICTSKSVHDALTGVLDTIEEDLRTRLGAHEFRRPLMPIIPLGVHAGRFRRNEPDRERWRGRLGLSDDTIAILFFGRLSVHAKASPFQLAQAAELAAGRVKAPLAIIWCGWFNDDFQRRVFMSTAKSMAPAVSFHHVDGRAADARFSVWSAADIFCSLSDNIQESFGLTVVEAMAAELPVVVSNWDGYREAVDDGRNGVLVDSYLPRVSLSDTGYRHVAGIDSYDQHVAALSQFAFVDLGQTANALVRLANDAGLRRTLATAGRRTVEETFDWKAVMPRYEQLWSEQLALLKRARSDSSRMNSTAWKVLDPSKTFAGFPSHRLAGDTPLVAGPLFARWSELVGEPGIVLNASVLTGRSQFLALQRLYADGRPHSLAETLSGFPADERDVIARTLHWAIKVGLLSLSK